MEILTIYLLSGVMLGTLTAWVADRHGRDFWVYLVFTVLFPFSVLISIPYLLIFTRRIERPPTDPDGGPPDRLAELQRLAELRDRGALSAEEFDAEKARLLAD